MASHPPVAALATLCSSLLLLVPFSGWLSEGTTCLFLASIATWIGLAWFRAMDSVAQDHHSGQQTGGTAWRAFGLLLWVALVVLAGRWFIGPRDASLVRYEYYLNIPVPVTIRWEDDVDFFWVGYGVVGLPPRPVRYEYSVEGRPVSGVIDSTDRRGEWYMHINADGIVVNR